MHRTSFISARPRHILSYRTRDVATGRPLLGITRHPPPPPAKALPQPPGHLQGLTHNQGYAQPLMYRNAFEMDANIIRYPTPKT